MIRQCENISGLNTLFLLEAVVYLFNFVITRLLDRRQSFQPKLIYFPHLSVFNRNYQQILAMTSKKEPNGTATRDPSMIKSIASAIPKKR